MDEERLNAIKTAAKDAAKEAIKANMDKILIVVLIFIAALLLISIIVGPFIQIEAIALEEYANTDETRSMSSASASSWEQFKRFVLTNEGGTKVDENGNRDPNGKYYIVENDSVNNPTIGHGLCLKSSDGYLNVEAFAAYGIDSKEMADNYFNGVYDIVSVEICDSIWNDLLYAKYESVVASCEGMNLTEYQLYALTDVKYRRGNINGFESEYTEKWSSDDDKYGENISGESYDLSSLYNFFYNGGHSRAGVNTRKKNQWLLFKYGYYNPLGEYWQVSYNTGGGVYGSVSSEENYVVGTFTSNITGRTFTLINQNGTIEIDQDGTKKDVKIFPAQCNRASGLIILSGYYSGTVEQLISYGQANGSGFPFSSTNLYNNTGLEITKITNVDSSNYQEYIANELQKGNYILMRFDKPTTGKSGSTWSESDGHWISILGYKVEDGVEKIFTGDPGWLNNDWYDISEFEGSSMQYVYLVTPTE